MFIFWEFCPVSLLKVGDLWEYWLFPGLSPHSARLSGQKIKRRRFGYGSKAVVKGLVLVLRLVTALAETQDRGGDEEINLNPFSNQSLGIEPLLIIPQTRVSGRCFPQQRLGAHWMILIRIMVQGAPLTLVSMSVFSFCWSGRGFQTNPGPTPRRVKVFLIKRATCFHTAARKADGVCGTVCVCRWMSGRDKKIITGQSSSSSLLSSSTSSSSSFHMQ